MMLKNDAASFVFQQYLKAVDRFSKLSDGRSIKAAFLKN